MISAAIVTYPASTHSTTLIFFFGAICSGLPTRAQYVVQPVKPSLVGLPMAVKRDTICNSASSHERDGGGGAFGMASACSHGGGSFNGA